MDDLRSFGENSGEELSWRAGQVCWIEKKIPFIVLTSVLWNRQHHFPISTLCRYKVERDVFKGKPSNYLKSCTTPADNFTFASKTVAANIDFCNILYVLYSQRQFFLDWGSIMALYPVFSPAKAKGFSDVQIPSHYYYGNTPWYTTWKVWFFFLLPVTQGWLVSSRSLSIQTMPGVGLTMGGWPGLNELLPVDDVHGVLGY